MDVGWRVGPWIQLQQQEGEAVATASGHLVSRSHRQPQLTRIFQRHQRRRISRSPQVPPEVAAAALPALPSEYSAATAGLAVEFAPHEDMICHPTRAIRVQFGSHANRKASHALGKRG
jgi:hypothetical protein